MKYIISIMCVFVIDDSITISVKGAFLCLVPIIHIHGLAL